METRKGGDIPEEVKNQVIDGKKRVVTEKLPKGFLDDLDKETEKQKKLAQEFYGLSREVVSRQEKMQEINTRLKNSEEAKGRILQHAFKKMKLGKRKDRRWNFKVDSFVGVLNVQPKPAPKKEEK
jgi:hypothetical protein